MTFPVSGVETAPWIPPLVACVISFFTSMGGVSGAFLLLPFQMSVLGFVSPAVTPTNLVFNIIGIPGHGLDAALESIGLGRLSMATIALGTAEEALEKSIEYATRRKQFGRPIGKFQLVQELIAEMATEVECARLLVYKGWVMLSEGQGSSLAFSMAKYFCTEMAIRVTSKAIEIHGAYGLSEEYPVERYFRDARCLTFPDATSEIQKLIIGRELLGMQAFV